MPTLSIQPSSLQGHLQIPPSKSQTIRAIVFGMMAEGTTCIENHLSSPDTDAMIEAARLFGAKIDVGTGLTIEGLGGKLLPAENVIDCGNSGLVLRFAGALAALLPTYTILTGDHSIRHNRLVKPLLEGLQQWGALAISSRLDDGAPLIVRGPLRGGTASISGEDSQPVSALLIAGAFSPYSTELYVSNPGEKPWVAMTLDWFRRLQIPFICDRFGYYKMEGKGSIQGFNYTVPADFSTAAFPLAAALVTQSELTLHGLDMDDPQGDKAVISLLQKMGAKIEIDPAGKSVVVKKGGTLTGMRIDVNDCVDALPILAVIGCFAEGKTQITGGAIARKKESDRISCMARELKKMGGDIEETADGLIVRPAPLRGANMESHADHRLGLALCVAALGASGESSIAGIECARKSYPSFFADFLHIGARMEKR